MNKWNIVSKVLGGVAAAGIAYDSHYVGKKCSSENVKIKQANRISDVYMPSRRLENRSKLTSDLKDKYFRFHLNLHIFDKINAATGYIKGAFKQLADNIIPASLATGALLSRNYSKLFGIGLIAYGLKYLITDVVDVGRINHLD